MRRLAPIVTAILTIPLAFSLATARADDKAERLFEQQPFDRITLNAAGNGATFDVVLLDLPNRQVPNPLPTSGSLTLRRLDKQSVLYEVSWTSIANIELFEQLLLQEAVRLTNAKKFVEAYDYLAFLHKNYPQLPRLGSATEQYLKQDAMHALAAGKHDEALTILLALYARNAHHPGLTAAVEHVGDLLITSHLKTRNFSAARGVLQLLKKGFPKLALKNIAGWDEKFQNGAQRQLATAQHRMDEKKFSAARRAVRQASDILPTIAGGNDLLTKINRLWPEVIVGVSSFGKRDGVASKFQWSALRTARLLEPRLVELSGYNSSGPVYQCRWAELIEDESGMSLELQLGNDNTEAGISPDAIVRRLLEVANPANPDFRIGIGNLLQKVTLNNGNGVTIHWQRPYVRPEALLQIPTSEFVSSASSRQTYREVDAQVDMLRYELSTVNNTSRRGPRSIIQRIYKDDDRAVEALIHGSIDMLDRVPPWQVDRLSRTAGIVVSRFSLPTVHVLIPSSKNPLLGRREFRRALCYGINRQKILHDVLLGGRNQAGFRVLSGPFPAGTSSSDPISYAYKQQLRPRPYEPRLAAVLANVARISVAKQLADSDNTSSKETESKEKEPETEATSEPQPLVLAHLPDPIARTACQTIRLHLGAIGIPIELLQLSSEPLDSQPPYDLLYAELTIWEPLVDARPLLGPRGLSGRCSASMGLALEDLDQAGNTKDLIARLKDIHQLAYSDLSIIPLWQTINHFAHRSTLRGIGRSPITLYQNIDQWKFSYELSSR